MQSSVARAKHLLAAAASHGLLGLLVAGCLSTAAGAAPKIVDLRVVEDTKSLLFRTYGHTGQGDFGVPVAGAYDVDGDGHPDTAMASMVADPLGRANAGEVYLVFGDGTLGPPVDTATVQARVLRIIGAGVSENAGSEIWMDDVTGDGLGDLLIARQNHSPTGRAGAGALTILVGAEAVGTYADTLADVDLAAPPASLTMLTFLGPAPLDRLGIWMRTGDVTGDQIADIVVGADQADSASAPNTGEVYVIRGGSHLASSQTIDLANFGSTALAGQIMRIEGTPLGSNFHFGATCQIADLDGNGTAEVMAAAALNRAGAALRAEGQPIGSARATGGSTDGTLYIAWDDNFAGVWPDGYSFVIDMAPGTTTVIDGAACNTKFGEEILGGLDYDDDGNPDLFVGDITGNCGPSSRPAAGSGHVFYDAAQLAGLTIEMDSPPMIPYSDFYGAEAGNIAADTAMHGDFDGDGIADLAFSSPHASADGRVSSGVLHIFFGSGSEWPAAIDLADIPDSVRVTEVIGGEGSGMGGSGDTLAYSGAASDVDGDGREDIITNEMLGDGVLPAALDVGNLIVLSGGLLIAPIPVPEPGPVGAVVAAAVILGMARLGRLRREPAR